jgi:Helix-turn-helix domain
MTAAKPSSRSQRWITAVDGHRLRELRRQRGLAREELARLANVSLTTLARLERSRRAIRHSGRQHYGLVVAAVSRLAKRPRSGLALTRRTRPRQSCSEEDGTGQSGAWPVGSGFTGDAACPPLAAVDLLRRLFLQIADRSPSRGYPAASPAVTLGVMLRSDRHGTGRGLLPRRAGSCRGVRDAGRFPLLLLLQLLKMSQVFRRDKTSDGLGVPGRRGSWRGCRRRPRRRGIRASGWIRPPDRPDLLLSVNGEPEPLQDGR